MMNLRSQKPESRIQKPEVGLRVVNDLMAFLISLPGHKSDVRKLLKHFWLLASGFWILTFSPTVTSVAGTRQQPTPPPPRARPAPAPIVTSYTDAAATIIETSIATGQFRKLVSAIQFAEMVDALKADGPFTVFAPSDEAFARLPKERTDALFADRDKMRMFLNSCIVRGKVMAADRVKAAKPVNEFPEVFTFTAESVAALAPARTVAGNLLAIRSQAGAHTLGGAKIARTDILCSNGIIHVIDTVALP